MNKKRKSIILGLLVTSILLVTIGVTYAFFSYSKSGTTENAISSGSVTFLYDEIYQSGNSISITDALPVSDTLGKAQTNAFNFKIQSTTIRNMPIPYEITLRQKQGTDNIGNVVKVYLAKTNSYSDLVENETELVTSKFNSLPDVTHNGYSEKTLYVDEVPQNSPSYEQYYRLKMWIDDKTDFSDGTYSNKTFSVMVNVYANGRISSSNANIQSISVGNTVLTAVNANEYETTLPAGTEQANILVETEDAHSTVTITKTQSDYTTPVAVANNIQRLSNTVSRTVSLTEGDNYFKIVANSENNQNNKEVHLKITVEPSSFVLKNQILLDNTLITSSPTLTTSSNNTSNTSGLYKLNVTNGFGGSNGDTYYFRGNVINNYVDFAGKIWRIVRINEDGTVRLILDDSTDTSGHQFNSTDNNYTYMYYSISQVKNDVETWYSANITGEDATKVAVGNYFCEQAKALRTTDHSSGNATMTFFLNYTPDLKCETDGNGKGLINNSVGLMNYDELVLAGAYLGQSNSSYYLYKDFYWWTMSACGCDPTVVGTPPSIWYVSTSGGLSSATVRGTSSLRPVINLKADTLATGTGISGDPYVVQ